MKRIKRMRIGAAIPAAVVFCVALAAVLAGCELGLLHALNSIQSEQADSGAYAASAETGSLRISFGSAQDFGFTEGLSVAENNAAAAVSTLGWVGATPT